MSDPAITEIDRDTFWALINQAKEHRGGPNEWLMEQLMGMGPEQAKQFDDIASAYIKLAHQYGLWSAAAVMDRYGFTEYGFLDFRRWLVGQGKEVYMGALRDPDTLADAADYRKRLFEPLVYMGKPAYQELTGRPIYKIFDLAEIQVLKTKLAQDIVYGTGVNYLYNNEEIPLYLPRLCAKYLTPEEIRTFTALPFCNWDLNDPDIQAARQGPKSKKVKRKRDDAR